MHHHFKAILSVAILVLGLSPSIYAAPTPLSAQVSLEARASAGTDSDIQSDAQDWTTAGVLAPLTIPVTAKAADATSTVITTGSVSASWTDSASGTVSFEDVGWTASNCPVSSCAAQLNLNPNLDWEYRFTADEDGVFTMDWTVAPDATTTDTLGLIGIYFFWNGALQEALRIGDGSGTVQLPVEAGQTYAVGLRNGANLSGFVGSPVSLMDASMTWHVDPIFTPMAHVGFTGQVGVVAGNNPTFQSEQVRLKGEFDLGAGSDGLDVTNNPIFIDFESIADPILIVNPTFIGNPIFHVAIPAGSMAPDGHGGYVIAFSDPLASGATFTVTRDDETLDLTGQLASLVLTLAPQGNGPQQIGNPTFYKFELSAATHEGLVGTNDPLFLPLAATESGTLTIGNDRGSFAGLGGVLVIGHQDPIFQNDPIFIVDPIFEPVVEHALADLSGTVSIHDPTFDPGASPVLKVKAGFSLDQDSDGLDANDPIFIDLIGTVDPVFINDPTFIGDPIFRVAIPAGLLQDTRKGYSLKSTDLAADGIVYGIYRDGVLETDLTDRLDVLALKLTRQGNRYAISLKINGFTQTTNPVFLPANAAQGLRVIIGNDGAVTGTSQSNFEIDDPNF